jgi:hypothetical protein
MKAKGRSFLKKRTKQLLLFRPGFVPVRAFSNKGFLPLFFKKADLF